MSHVPRGIFRKLMAHYTNPDMTEATKKRKLKEIRQAYKRLNDVAYYHLTNAGEEEEVNGVKFILDKPNTTDSEIEVYANAGFPTRIKPAKSATKTLKVLRHSNSRKSSSGKSSSGKSTSGKSNSRKSSSGKSNSRRNNSRRNNSHKNNSHKNNSRKNSSSK